MRASLIDRTRDVLQRAGFYLTADAPMRPVSFDLVARRDRDLLIVKVLTNVDSLTDAVAQELRVLAEFLEGRPLLVGERSSSRPLEAGAMYARHGVPILTLDTLSDYLLEGAPPLVYAAPGGFYVTLDGERLKRIREERGLSLGDLAQVAGVSRRAISMYEEGMGAMVEVAQRLEEFLNEALVAPVDPLRAPAEGLEVVLDVDRLHDVVQREMLRFMGEIGFRVAALERGPFAGLAKADETILTGLGSPETPPSDLAKKARAVANLCEVTETFGVFFVAKRPGTRVAVEGMPLLGLDELARVDDPARLVGVLEERRKRAR